MLTLKPSDYRPYEHQVNFDHRLKTQVNRFPHQKQVIFGPHSKTKSISIHTLKSSNCRPAHKNEVTFDLRIKIMPISICIQKPSQNFDHAHKNRFNLDPVTEIESISILTLMSSRCRSPDTKTELISIQTLQKSRFRPPHENKVDSDPYTEIKSISTTHTTSK